MSTSPTPLAAPGGAGPLASLRQHLAVVLLVVVAAGTGAWFAAASLPDQFESEAILALEPANDRGSDASLIRLRAPTYVSYLLADATQDQIAAALADDAALDDLAVELVSDTGTIVISTTSTSAELARDTVAAVVAQAVDFSTAELNLQLSVVADPVVPTRPSGPPRNLLVAAGVLTSGLLAVGAALVWDRVRPRLRDPNSLQRLVSTATVTVVPKRPRVDIDAASTDARVLTAIRVLRTHLERDVHLPATIAVVSPGRGEGRTTVTALLGRSLANLDLRVLLVDADPERRDLSRPADGGASPRGGDLDPSRIIPTRVDGLSLLTLGADLESDDVSRRLPALLAEVRDDVDVVLIDTPPLLGDDLARAVAVSSDHALLVVPMGLDWDALERTAAALENLRVDVAGAVVNFGRGRRSAS